MYGFGQVVKKEKSKNKEVETTTKNKEISCVWEGRPESQNSGSVSVLGFGGEPKPTLAPLGRKEFITLGLANCGHALFLYLF